MVKNVTYLIKIQAKPILYGTILSLKELDLHKFFDSFTRILIISPYIEDAQLTSIISSLGLEICYIPALNKSKEILDKCLVSKQNLRTEYKSNKISIILPVYNEEKNIEETIKEVKKLPFNPELIVVDDNSRDKTSTILETLSGFTFIQHRKNFGYKQSLREGISASHGDIIVYLDADGSYKPQEIPELIKPILEGKSDLVIGSKQFGFYVGSQIPVSSRFIQLFIDFLLRLIFGLDLKSSQSRFRAMTKNVKHVYENFYYKPQFINTESLIRVKQAGFRISEVPITENYRKSSISRIRIISLFSSILMLFLFCLIYPPKKLDKIVKEHLIENISYKSSEVNFKYISKFTLNAEWNAPIS